MPRYHFHLTGQCRSNDLDGTELDDVQHARREAVIFFGAFLRDNPDVAWENHNWRVECCDDTGAFLFAVMVLAISAPDRIPATQLPVAA